MKTIKRTGVTLNPDRSRVLVRPFSLPNEQRVSNICGRVMALPETEVHTLLDQVLAEFGDRHQQTRDLLRARFERVKRWLLTDSRLSEARQLLLGAYFTHEYALEAAALFNPSVVPHPDQSGLQPGALRFILSLRATGEGHISSITFRTGFVDPRNQISLNSPTRFLTEPQQVPNASYEKPLFERKLYELGLTNPFSRRVMGQLPNAFTLDELQKKLDLLLNQVRATEPESDTVAKGILLLAQSNHEVQFAPESRLSGANWTS